ncbi:MAG: hypothetical protein SFW09_11100 [Hyphomicrobiaceae bacterium]|nr:hypothetical protein [Hyphomicrobiaceae bacterium]
MSTPITDKAEVSIDFPDKFYLGSFGRGSRLEVTADKDGAHIHLDRPGDERRHVGFHVHYYLLEDIIGSLAEAIASVDGLDPVHRQRLGEAAGRLTRACSG